MHFEEKLLKRQQQGNLRELRAVTNLVDFSSNDYLGLARSATLASMVNEEIAQRNDILHGFGSTGSRLLTGHTEYVHALEEQIAHFHGFEAGLLFNCGFMANQGLLSTILEENDTVFFDSCIHASTYTGIRLSKAKAFPFRHNDLFHLEQRLKQAIFSKKRMICVESVYSMDGSKAPLSDVCHLAEKYQAEVIVDEAHATGICGPLGKGLLSGQQSLPNIFAKVVTFGKALGVHGAIVLGSKLLKQTLTNFSAPFIYTTALPWYALAAIKCTYQLFPKLEKERLQLKNLIHTFSKHFNASETPIQSIPCQGNDHAKQIAKSLSGHGYDVRPILSPTVRRGHEILRINLHAFNTEEQLVSLLKHIKSKKNE